MTLVDDVHTILGDENGAVSVSGLQPTTRLDYTDTNRPKIHFTRHKVIQSGNVIETYEYESPIICGKRPSKKRHGHKHNRSEEYQQKTITRAMFRLRRLVTANFSRNDKFITLTFNNNQEFDINDPITCLKYFQLCMRRIRKAHTKFKYIAVPEFQKRGAVHYHMICNLPYMKPEEFNTYWTYGIFDLKAIGGDTNLAFYLAKYLQKRFEHNKKSGHRLYYSSKGLQKPVTVYGNIAEQIVKGLAKGNHTVQYQSTYKSEHNGTVHHQLFSGMKS